MLAGGKSSATISLPVDFTASEKSVAEPRPQAMSIATTAHFFSLRSFSQGFTVAASIADCVLTRKTRLTQLAPVSSSALLTTEM